MIVCDAHLETCQSIFSVNSTQEKGPGEYQTGEADYIGEDGERKRRVGRRQGRVI